MFTIEGKEYELKFNMNRLRLIERAASGMAAMSQLATDTSGLMSITAMERFFSYGLKEAGADEFVSPAKGAELCDAMMEEAGYAAVVQEIQKAVMRDVPFLFRTA